MKSEVKNGIRRICTASLALALLVPCTSVPVKMQAASGIKLSKSNISLKEGENATLKLKNVGRKKRSKVRWSNSAGKVVSVKVNKKNRTTVTITAKKKGKAVITAKLSGKKYTCNIKVNKDNTSEVQSSTPTPEVIEKQVIVEKQVVLEKPSPSPTPQIVYVEVTPVPAQDADVTPTPTQGATASTSPTEEANVTTAPTEAAKVTATPTATANVTAVPTEAANITATPTATVSVTTAPTEAANVTATPTAVSGNITYQGDVHADMSQASYWYNKCENPDEVLVSPDDIEVINQCILSDNSTNMYDLLNRPETYNATARKEALVSAIDTEVKRDRVKGRTFYLDGKVVTDPESFYTELKENIGNAATEESANVRYALCVNSAELKMAPVDGFIGWNPTDSDDEFVNARLNVNEPFIVEAETADGRYYWGRSNNCTGWVRADHFAICDDKSEWAAMWTGSGDDILVVTTDTISLAPSVYNKNISKLELQLGTVLPLVPETEMPESVDGRSTWHNYVVYIPTRDEDGKFVRSVALISMNRDVNVGYLPFTQKNLLKVAFTCLGDRYGWGGMMDLMDCSLYTRNVYKCFGFELARNTTWQSVMPVDRVKLTGMSDDEKRNIIESVEPGSLLMFRGHIMMYIGSEGGRQYVISDVGSMKETAEHDTSEKPVTKNVLCVGINSLDVRRDNGNTWLQDMEWVIRPWKPLYTKQSVSYDTSWEYGRNSKINSGQATLYTVTASNAKDITVCINAGHGTAGGDQYKTLCHPDGSPKIVTGSTAAGALEATAVSLGMTMNDGTPERVVTLNAAKAAKKVLLANGYNVLMIRDGDDVQLDNIARTLIANHYADCHIAIHYDSDGRSDDKGVFFCSIPDNEAYKNMEPVKSHWEEHMRLGECAVNGLVEEGLKKWDTGALEMDLTQTSYSTVPSIDLEVGNQCSDVSVIQVRKIAQGILNGVNDYFGK